MARIEILPPQQQQEIAIHLLKVMVDEAKRMGIDNLPAALFVFGPDIPLVVGTMDGFHMKLALKEIQNLAIEKTENRTKG